MPQATLKQKDVEFSYERNYVQIDKVVAKKFGLIYGIVFGTLLDNFLQYGDMVENPFPFSKRTWMNLGNYLNSILPEMSYDEQVKILKKLEDEGYIEFREIDGEIIYTISENIIGETE